ncbi:hypothetical protein PG997_002841 [Apiospora hydei]|uniref:Uncharacterized protein n=1 Tax=Apiospora hydei TaxID=1337664 RepID=A0ABR1WXI9_9PEZI
MSSSVLIGESCPVSIPVVVAVFVDQRGADCINMEELSSEVELWLSVHDRPDGFRTIAIDEQSMALECVEDEGLLRPKSQQKYSPRGE